MKEKHSIDPKEAPLGYRPVLKATAKPKDDGNICRACDWRKSCQSDTTDFSTFGHRCMAHARRDGQAVLFKLASPQLTLAV